MNAQTRDVRAEKASSTEGSQHRPLLVDNFDQLVPAFSAHSS
jgi:hypothetical protein